MSNVILASGSKYRADLLQKAGIELEVHPSSIDERAVEAPLIESGMDASGMAEILALAKAEQVSAQFSGAWVIGCDQTLTLDGELLHKPEDMEAARRRLLSLSGQTHQLTSAVVIVRNSEIMWRHDEIASITFRSLDPAEIGKYLAEAGETALTSVGAYQVEGLGIRLISKIDGDYFSVIGLPLIPLIGAMRDLQIIRDF